LLGAPVANRLSALAGLTVRGCGVCYLPSLLENTREPA